MVGKSKLTYSAILKKLGTHWDWSQFGPNDELMITYEKFREIMMTDENTAPIMTYERTVKAKFKELIDFGFLQQANQYSCRWNIKRVKQQIGLLPPDPVRSATAYPDTFSSPECPPTTARRLPEKIEEASQ